jgi:hypothetical protein
LKGKTMNTTSNVNALERITVKTGELGHADYFVDEDLIATTRPAVDGSHNQEVCNLVTGAIYYANGIFDADALARRIAQSHLFPIVAQAQIVDFNNAQRLLAELGAVKAKLNNVREYIQASIDRGEWDGELDEIFWDELADTLGLDLKKTEEIEVRFTVTYEATLTVPKGTDIDDLELEASSYPDIRLNGDLVGDARWEETEVANQ